MTVPNALVRPYRGLVPRIHESVLLLPTAVVVGDVEIGPESNIWFQTVSRGDVHPPA